MTVRFDAEKMTLELSVADLLEGTLKRNLGFANRGGYERLWLGQAIHSSYQERAEKLDPTYRREVRLVQTLEHRGWTARIQGRADGLRKEADGRIVVEEIKSVRRGGQIAPTTREMYERQASTLGCSGGRLARRTHRARSTSRPSPAVNPQPSPELSSS